MTECIFGERMDPVISFNLPVHDMAHMSQFYAQIFGWNIEKRSGGGDYHRVETFAHNDEGPVESGAVNGGLFLSGTHGISEPFLEILVGSIDETIGLVADRGGKLIVPKKALGKAGNFAIVQDPEGNFLGLWEDR